MSSKKLELKSFHICDKAFFSEDKKLNVIGVFDQIFADTFPITHPFMSLATLFEGPSDQSFEIEYSILGPDKKVILPEKKVNVELSHSGKSNFVLNIPMLTFQKAGNYSFQTSYKKELLGSAELNVIEVRGGAQNGSKGKPVN